MYTADTKSTVQTNNAKTASGPLEFSSELKMWDETPNTPKRPADYDSSVDSFESTSVAELSLKNEDSPTNKRALYPSNSMYSASSYEEVTVSDDEEYEIASAAPDLYPLNKLSSHSTGSYHEEIIDDEEYRACLAQQAVRREALPTNSGHSEYTEVLLSSEYEEATVESTDLEDDDLDLDNMDEETEKAEKNMAFDFSETNLVAKNPASTRSHVNAALKSESTLTYAEKSESGFVTMQSTSMNDINEPPPMTPHGNGNPLQLAAQLGITVDEGDDEGEESQPSIRYPTSARLLVPQPPKSKAPTEASSSQNYPTGSFSGLEIQPDDDQPVSPLTMKNAHDRPTFALEVLANPDELPLISPLSVQNSTFQVPASKMAKFDTKSKRSSKTHKSSKKKDDDKPEKRHSKKEEHKSSKLKSKLQKDCKESSDDDDDNDSGPPIVLTKKRESIKETSSPERHKSRFIKYKSSPTKSSKYIEKEKTTSPRLSKTVLKKEPKKLKSSSHPKESKRKSSSHDEKDGKRKSISPEKELKRKSSSKRPSTTSETKQQRSSIKPEKELKRKSSSKLPSTTSETKQRRSSIKPEKELKRKSSSKRTSTISETKQRRSSITPEKELKRKSSSKRPSTISETKQRRSLIKPEKDLKRKSSSKRPSATRETKQRRNKKEGEEETAPKKKKRASEMTSKSGSKSGSAKRKSKG
jgi:hypothetical protein